MKRIFFFFFFMLLGPFLSLAQVDTSEYRKPEMYATALNYHLQQLQRQPASAYQAHQVACYFALQQQLDSMLRYALLALRNGDRPEALLVDTDFESCHNASQWATLRDTIRGQLLRRNVGITHPELAWELWLMGVEDQRPRTLRQYHKTGIPSDGGFKQREARILDIVSTYGWPTFSMVGHEAATAAFLVVQHTNAIVTCLPKLIEAAKAGEAELRHAAMMIDRYLCMRNRPVQIYGTQFRRDVSMDFATGVLSLSTTSRPVPIADLAGLAARRERVGLPLFEESCREQQADGQPVQNAGRIRRRWVRRGYLL